MRMINWNVFLLYILLAAAGNVTYAITPKVAVEQLVQGTTIKDVSLAPVPHSNAVRLSIDTSAGRKAIILPKNQVHVALSALKNPHTTGTNNAAISARIINQKPTLMHFSKSINSKPMPLSQTTQQTKQTATPSAPAIAITSVISANQQASR